MKLPIAPEATHVILELNINQILITLQLVYAQQVLTVHLGLLIQSLALLVFTNL
jgi:hypothetical protein